MFDESPREKVPTSLDGPVTYDKRPYPVVMWQRALDILKEKASA